MGRRQVARILVVMAVMCLIAFFILVFAEISKPKSACAARLTVPLSVEGDPIPLQPADIVFLQYVNQEGQYAFLKYNQASQAAQWVWVTPTMVDIVQSDCVIHRV